jgi:hypothetical protein
MVQSLPAETLQSVVSYYLAQGAMSDPRAYAVHLQPLPADVPGLVETLQGLVMHVFWAERYGQKLSEARKSEVQIRPAAQKLARMLELDAAPLFSGRPYERRLVGNCRDFSLLCSTMLRAKGIAARTRCGFGTYFTPGKYEDHWVIEYWHAAQQRWVMVDPQLDDLQKQVLKIQFDSLDMPPGAFVIAGEAWKMCRAGQADPERFGIFQWHGMDFIRGNLMRDLLALNKFEVLPWDMWSALEPPVAACSDGQLAQYDRIADLTLAGHEAFPALQSIVAENESFHAPAHWAN